SGVRPCFRAGEPAQRHHGLLGRGKSGVRIPDEHDKETTAATPDDVPLGSKHLEVDTSTGELLPLCRMDGIARRLVHGQDHDNILAARWRNALTPFFVPLLKDGAIFFSGENTGWQLVSLE